MTSNRSFTVRVEPRFTGGILQLEFLSDRKQTAIVGTIAVYYFIGVGILIFACQQIGIAGIIV